MKILISGSSGLIGTELVSFLIANGHQVVRLVRHENQLAPDTIYWDPEQNSLDPYSLEGFDAVINLSGESIGEGRWTEKRKKKILDSRVQSTATLANTLAKLTKPPSVFIVASAIGIYGNRGSAFSPESTPPGEGFLAEVCKKWEEATLPAVRKGIRTVNLRFGLVLSPKGGALAKMLPIFNWGLGGTLGNGQQYMSWVTLEDLVSIVLFVLNEEGLKGPINVVTPYPETNAVFTKTLGKVLGKPTFFAVPAFVLRLALGREMANEMLLSSSRVEPLRLTQAGYVFLYPEIEMALMHMFEEVENKENGYGTGRNT